MDLLWQGPNETAQINCDDVLEALRIDISRLKSSDTVRRICLSPSSQPQQSEAKSKAVVELVMDLLKTNTSIKHLKMHGVDAEVSGVRSFLFEALAKGEQADHLEHLDVRPMRDGSYGALPRYLTQKSSNNLKSLRLFLTHDDPRTLQVVSSLAKNSGVTSLYLNVKMGAPWLEELGCLLHRCCTSISTLGVKLYSSRGEEYHVPKAFLEGIAKMPRLRKIRFDTTTMPRSLLDSITSLVVQHGSLETVCIETEFERSLSHHWAALSAALSNNDITNVSLRSLSWDSDALDVALRGLTHAKVLNVVHVCHDRSEADFSSICSTLARLPKVESVTIGMFFMGPVPMWAERPFLEMVRTSRSGVLTNAELKTETTSSSSRLKDQVAYYCVWNKVRSTMLGRVHPSGIWPHVLSHLVQRRPSGASLVHRLLCEKPELMSRAGVSKGVA